MKDPYARMLAGLKNRKVTIQRADAPDVEGEVVELDHDSCSLKPDKTTGGHPESATYVFIALKDIRGVVMVDWDPDMMH